MAEGIDPISIILASRPQAPVYQADDSQEDVIRPAGGLVLPNGQSVGLPLRPGDPGWERRFAPTINGRRNSMAPERLLGDTPASYPNVAPPEKPKRRKKGDVVGAIEQLTVTDAQNAAYRPTGLSKRLVVNYARQDGEYMVSVEAAPEWDTVGKPRRVSQNTLVEILPVLSSLEIKVKLNVEEDFSQ